MVGLDPTIHGLTRGLDPRPKAEDDDGGWDEVANRQKAGPLPRPGLFEGIVDQAESLAITSSETSKFE